jgi:hypothetical protein
MSQRSVRNTGRARKPVEAKVEGPAVEEPEVEAAVESAASDAVADDDGGEVTWELGGIPRRNVPAPEPAMPLAERLRRIPPGIAILTLAAILSLGFLLFQIANRTASVQLLTSAGLVCGMVYVAVAMACAAATWRLGHEGRFWAATLVAFVGGCAAFVAAGSFAGALVLFLALGF